MNKTNIDYMDFSWNPLAMRCSKISPACDHCWHLRMANRLAMNPTVRKQQRKAYSGWGGPVLCGDRLMAPFKRKKPSRIGVQFMGDLFHEDVSFTDHENVMGIIERSPQHVFMFLTKRPNNMSNFLKSFYRIQNVEPYRNLWVGVTVENQRHDDRILILKEIPAAVRFLSFEPLLGPFDFLPPWLRYIDWVIVGGETGPAARPMHPDWARAIRDQCQEAGIPYYFKGWGEFANGSSLSNETVLEGARHWEWAGEGREAATMARIGKKKSGALLDGREWREFPSEIRL